MNKKRTISEEHKQKIREGVKKRVLTDEYRNKLSKAKLGKKQSKEHSYKNMLAHLSYDVTLEWLTKFDDIKKLSYINQALGKEKARSKSLFNTNDYINFIERFYYDENFNKLYDLWVLTNDKWIKPSLDHITPRSKGGKLVVDNIQFISWLENRTKNNMLMEEWLLIKEKINYYL